MDDNIYNRLNQIENKFTTVQVEILHIVAEIRKMNAVQMEWMQSELNSMNEMSEMTSMRLQMEMDRRSKFIEALSNIMKKIDDTEETIISNMK